MLRALPLLLALCTTTALAEDATVPHPHQGILEPYTVAPPTPELSAEELERLAQGKPVKRQVEGEAGGRGVAIQDVHADPATVWSKIIDFEAYPRMVDNVDLCEIYEQDGEQYKVHFRISAMMVKVGYYIDHTYRPDQGYMIWKMDYSRESDLDDSVGFWRVEALPDKPGWTRVTYSVDVRLRGWVPAFIEDVLSKKGLTKATAWVKRESEAAAAATE